MKTLSTLTGTENKAVNLVTVLVLSFIAVTLILAVVNIFNNPLTLERAF